METVYPQHYVVLTPEHALEIQALKWITGNIVDFMDEIGGGAVLVRLTKADRPGSKVKFEISRIANGEDGPGGIGRTAFKVPASRMKIVSIGGTIQVPGSIQSTRAAKKSAKTKAART